MNAPVFAATRTHTGFETTGPPVFRAGQGSSGDDVFAQWQWANGRLEIERDRWGVQPLFWSVTPRSVHISTSIDALLAAGVPAELDDGAMAVFLRTGFFVGDDTPFTAIRSLPVATSAAWTPDGPTLTGTWRYPRTAAFTRAAAERHFADCFTASVNRRLRASSEPVAVPLSGGHDSRHILLAMHELARLP